MRCFCEQIAADADIKELIVLSSKGGKCSPTQKMINCEHVIVQHVVSLFFQLNVNKLNTISVSKGVYAIYQGLSKRRLCKEFVRRKVNNVPGINLHQGFSFACTSSFSARVIT